MYVVCLQKYLTLLPYLLGGPFFFASGVLYCIEFSGPNLLKGESRAAAVDSDLIVNAPAAWQQVLSSEGYVRWLKNGVVCLQACSLFLASLSAVI